MTNSNQQKKLSHQKENMQKSQHGQNAQISLESMLQQMQYRGYIKDISTLKEWSRPGHQGYRLYAPFVITLFNDERWALYSTTSYRSDRMKGNHWDSLLVKKYRNIKRCYLVIADTKQTKENSQADAEMASKDLQRSQGYDDSLDELDDALTSSSLYDIIESMFMKSLAHGVREASAGLNFEDRITDILSNKENLQTWQGDDLVIGLEYPIFKRLLTKWDCPHDITDITATTDIPKLPSGGSPKTDVLAIITYADGTEHHYTISCKNSNGKFVSAHQYNADAFIQALAIEDDTLKEQIRTFQRLGSKKKMAEQDETLPAAFEEALKPYINRLCEWVVSGQHGEYSTTDQIAGYLLAFDKESYTMEIFTASEYIDKMLAESHGQFGTPFQWTYASKSLGKNIQLKMPTFKL